MKKLRKLKKGLAILLTAVMVVGLMPFTGTVKVSAETTADVWDGSVASSFAGGSGTEEDPYQIATGAQLAYFAKVVNATAYSTNDYANAYYILTADIDLNNKTLGPIGKGTYTKDCFNGYFDGNNMTISNLTSSYGLFYKVGGDVTIKDLTLANVDISSTSYTGGLVYMVISDRGTSALISNCHISGTITSTSSLAVGLVYRADSSLTIENCSNSADITGQSYSAGILGKNYTKSTFDDYFITIRNCTNSGKVVNSSTSSSGGAAGIAGELQSKGKTLIENCVNTGEIVGQSGGDKYAGIVSYSECTAGNTIRNCENYGDITCNATKTSIKTAGICAAAYYTEIYDCSNVGTIHNDESALYCGGIVAVRGSDVKSCGSVHNCLNVGTVEPSYGGQIIGSESDTLSNVYDNFYVNGSLAANSVNNQNNYRVSQEQAESGYLAFVLNGLTSGNVWKQKLGTDPYPKINGSEDVVYANGNCSAKVTEYSNSPLSVEADKNHELIHVDTKAADCGHNGYNEHYECKSCHAFFENDTDNEPVSKSNFITGTATGNHLSYDEDGLCAVCGNAYESAVKDANGVYVIDNTGKFIWYANAITNCGIISTAIGDDEILLDGFDAKLEADIDLSLVYNEESGKSWKPIAYDGSKYLNELDGQGHTINGLYINSVSLNCAGLVDTMYYKTAYIHDIVFTNVNINAPRAAYVGTVAGKMESLKTAPCIENCIVESGTINGKTYVGGLVGYVCANNADKFQQEDKNIINNCANFASVNSASYAGGLVGYTEANGKNVNIANSYNVGIVTGGTSGDLVGKIDTNTAVVNCYHIGNNAFGENDVSATAEQKSAAQFASGEVAYLLNGSVSENVIWYQNLDESGDAYPVLKKDEEKDNTVYQYTNCAGGQLYTNDSALSGTTQSHDFSAKDGICKNCSYECDHAEGYENEACKTCGKAQSVTFDTHSLTLADEIGVNFMMILPEDAKTENAYMEFSISGKNGKTTNVPFSEAVALEDGRYKFTCLVNSIQMADTITATYHFGENETVTEEYSVKKYIEDIVASDTMDDTTKKLVKSLADYGYYAQLCLSEANGWTIGTDHEQMIHYTDAMDTEVDLSAYAYSQTGEVSGITRVNKSLVLDSKTAIRLLFTVDDTYGKEPVITVKDASDNTVETQLTKQSDGRYCLLIPGISAHKLGETYTIVVDGAMTIQMSALSYAHGVLQSDAMTDATKRAVAALNAYYNAALAYKNNQ
ncbi:MAG: hypothetical protein ACI4FX_04395 [Agathobacter sp.]